MRARPRGQADDAIEAALGVLRGALSLVWATSWPYLYEMCAKEACEAPQEARHGLPRARRRGRALDGAERLRKALRGRALRRAR